MESHSLNISDETKKMLEGLKKEMGPNNIKEYVEKRVLDDWDYGGSTDISSYIIISDNNNAFYVLKVKNYSTSSHPPDHSDEKSNEYEITCEGGIPFNEFMKYEKYPKKISDQLKGQEKTFKDCIIIKCAWHYFWSRESGGSDYDKIEVNYKKDDKLLNYFYPSK